MKKLPMKEQMALIQKGKSNGASRLRGSSKDLGATSSKTANLKKELTTNRGQSLDSTQLPNISSTLKAGSASLEDLQRSQLDRSYAGKL